MKFWTDERVEAYLTGVEDPTEMIVLDLFSEAAPQWNRTKSYYGKKWIWCLLHGMSLTSIDSIFVFSSRSASHFSSLHLKYHTACGLQTYPCHICWILEIRDLI